MSDASYAQHLQDPVPPDDICVQQTTKKGADLSPNEAEIERLKVRQELHLIHYMS